MKRVSIALLLPLVAGLGLAGCALGSIAGSAAGLITVFLVAGSVLLASTGTSGCSSVVHPCLSIVDPNPPPGPDVQDAGSAPAPDSGEHLHPCLSIAPHHSALEPEPDPPHVAARRVAEPEDQRAAIDRLESRGVLSPEVAARVERLTRR